VSNTNNIATSHQRYCDLWSESIDRTVFTQNLDPGNLTNSNLYRLKKDSLTHNNKNSIVMDRPYFLQTCLSNFYSVLYSHFVYSINT
jgi:hypothetical protein